MFKIRILYNLSLFFIITVLLLYIFTLIDSNKFKNRRLLERRLFQNVNANKPFEKPIKLDNDYNLWLIFTKVVEKSPLMYNFNNLIVNLLNMASIPLNVHIIVDDRSKLLAEKQINESIGIRSDFTFSFYNVSVFAEGIQDIVDAMTPHFSSKPGTYYSDALFYLSLGLYRLAPKSQHRAALIDCDVIFKEDVLNLYQQFESFNSHHLFGLAPELSPVYRHILFAYKRKHNTTFGDYYRFNSTIDTTIASSHPSGFQGYNSGVILLNFDALRASQLYASLITRESVKAMVYKYHFRGHLGDQDYYTLLGYEHPQLIRTLNCGFNRQLCTWWRDNGGYKAIFDRYFDCPHPTIVLHGNCNTKIPT